MIKTERLFIREQHKGDQPAVKRLITDRQAMRYLPDIFCETDAAVEQNLMTAIEEAQRSNRTKFFFAIEQKIDNQYVGNIGFTLETPPTIKGGIMNLGYFILPEFWGLGYTSEAAQAVIDYAFMHYDIHKITSGCLTKNTASERIMQKCGMTKEAEYAAHVWHEQQWKDRVEYRLLRHEWKALQ